MILRENYFWGLPDEPYLWELELNGRTIGGSLQMNPGSHHKCRRISAALIGLDIEERFGRHNHVAAARLLTELQGN